MTTKTISKKLLKQTVCLILCIYINCFQIARAQSVLQKLKRKVEKVISNPTNAAQKNSSNPNSNIPSVSNRGRNASSNKNSVTGNPNLSPDQSQILDDNSPIQLISNPTTGLQYSGDAILYNNALYLKFYNHLVSWDGTKYQIIEPPRTDYTYTGSPIVFNNKLYLLYESNVEMNWSLAEYDG